VNAVAFEEIRRFAYTGDCVLTKDNVFSVLRASELFKLARVEELCIKFIAEYLPIPGMLEAFHFACLTRKNRLKGVLSQYIMEHFVEWCDDNKFLELTFDDWNVLLSQRWYLPCEQESKLFDAIIRWLNYSRESRAQYSEQLMAQIQLEHIIEADTNYVMCTMKSVLLGHKCSTADVDCRTPQDSPAFEFPRLKTEIKSRIPKLSLHVYMHGRNRLMTVYSANKCNREWSTSCTMVFPYTQLMSVGINGYLFCLDYSNATKRHTFRACSSLDVSPTRGAHVKLKSPPAMMSKGFDLCNIRNNIYVNAWHEIDSSSSSNSVFTSEELSRGIYMYSIERDQWFPVPSTRTTKKGTSALLSYDDTLYLLGRDPDTCFYSLQTLDNRTSKWQILPKSIEFESIPSIRPCCAHRGSIYACPAGNFYNRMDVNVYDSVAGKWRKLESTSRISQPRRLVSYENWLWAFGLHSFSYDGNGRKREFKCIVYDDYAQEWIPAPISGSINLDSKGQENLHLQDVVVSKW
jgi:hypothetical protein